MNERRSPNASGLTVCFAFLAIVAACGDTAPSSPEDSASEDLRRWHHVCGNGTCGRFETCSNCPADCGVCPVDAGTDTRAPGEDASAGDASVGDAAVADAGRASAHELWVATTGSDSNPGTRA